MSSDSRAHTSEGRHRLKVHALEPVLLSPRARTVTTPSISAPNAETHLPPPRARGLSLPLGPTASRDQPRSSLESVAFDPFSGSQSFSLLKIPATSRRTDPRAVTEFHQWIVKHFPQLLNTFRALGLIREHQTRINDHDGRGDLELIGSNDEECEEAWHVLFRHASVVAVVPGERIVAQGVTPTGTVFFLLNGHCELSFKPTLLRDNKAQTARSTLPVATSSSECSSIRLREVVPGDFFGLDVAAFEFQRALTSVTARPARHRNFLGLREGTNTHILCLPFATIQQLQRRTSTPATFPFSFAPDAELFLRNTFLFRGMTDSSRRYLAAHLRCVAVAHREYLFTPGQPVRVFIIISGQLTLGSPTSDKCETAELELEMLQAHDSTGLMEATVLESTFERYCVATSTGGARAYVLPSTILLMVLAQEPAALELISEWVAQRKSWFELRRATALAQRKKLAAEGSDHVVRLAMANQRRSKLTCSRCGWSGHTSTSMSCVRAEIPVTSTRALSISLLDRRKNKSRESKRTPRQKPSVATPVDQPSLPRMDAHRRLKIDSIALQALRIPKLSMVQHLSSIGSMDRAEDGELPSEREKDEEVRASALTQSYQRLEVALGVSFK